MKLFLIVFTAVFCAIMAVLSLPFIITGLAILGLATYPV
jgi:hypothetical protein